MKLSTVFCNICKDERLMTFVRYKSTPIDHKEDQSSDRSSGQSHTFLRESPNGLSSGATLSFLPPERLSRSAPRAPRQAQIRLVSRGHTCSAELPPIRAGLRCRGQARTGRKQDGATVARGWVW